MDSPNEAGPLPPPPPAATTFVHPTLIPIPFHIEDGRKESECFVVSAQPVPLSFVEGVFADETDSGINVIELRNALFISMMSQDKQQDASPPAVQTPRAIFEHHASKASNSMTAKNLLWREIILACVSTREISTKTLPAWNALLRFHSLATHHTPPLAINKEKRLMKAALGIIADHVPTAHNLTPLVHHISRSFAEMKEITKVQKKVVDDLRKHVVASMSRTPPHHHPDPLPPPPPPPSHTMIIKHGNKLFDAEVTARIQNLRSRATVCDPDKYNPRLLGMCEDLLWLMHGDLVSLIAKNVDALQKHEENVRCTQDLAVRICAFITGLELQDIAYDHHQQPVGFNRIFPSTASSSSSSSSATTTTTSFAQPTPLQPTKPFAVQINTFESALKTNDVGMIQKLIQNLSAPQIPTTTTTLVQQQQQPTASAFSSVIPKHQESHDEWKAALQIVLDNILTVRNMHARVEKHPASILWTAIYETIQHMPLAAGLVLIFFELDSRKALSPQARIIALSTLLRDVLSSSFGGGESSPATTPPPPLPAAAAPSHPPSFFDHLYHQSCGTQEKDPPPPGEACGAESWTTIGTMKFTQGLLEHKNTHIFANSALSLAPCDPVKLMVCELFLGADIMLAVNNYQTLVHLLNRHQSPFPLDKPISARLKVASRLVAFGIVASFDYILKEYPYTPDAPSLCLISRIAGTMEGVVYGMAAHAMQSMEDERMTTTTSQYTHFGPTKIGHLGNIGSEASRKFLGNPSSALTPTTTLKAFFDIKTHKTKTNKGPAIIPLLHDHGDGDDDSAPAPIAAAPVSIAAAPTAPAPIAAAPTAPALIAPAPVSIAAAAAAPAMIAPVPSKTRRALKTSPILPQGPILLAFQGCFIQKYLFEKDDVSARTYECLYDQLTGQGMIILDPDQISEIVPFRPRSYAYKNHALGSRNHYTKEDGFGIPLVCQIVPLDHTSIQHITKIRPMFTFQGLSSSCLQPPSISARHFLMPLMLPWTMDFVLHAPGPIRAKQWIETMVSREFVLSHKNPDRLHHDDTTTASVDTSLVRFAKHSKAHKSKRGTTTTTTLELDCLPVIKYIVACAKMNVAAGRSSDPTSLLVIHISDTAHVLCPGENNSHRRELTEGREYHNLWTELNRLVNI